MATKMKSLVEVAVFDNKGELLPKAEVSLYTLEQEQGRSIELRYSSDARAHRTVGVEAGYYMLRAEAKGLEPVEREVQVHPGGLNETVILGEKGLPFYYRGRVKVPFEPHDDLLGVSLRPMQTDTGEDEENLLALARKLKLEYQQVGETILQNNIRVFHFPDRTGEGARREVQQRLEEHPIVRTVGPVIRIDKESISFLSSELVVKFQPDVTIEDAQDIAARHDLRITRSLPYAGNTYLCSAPAASYELLETCEKLVRSGRVEYAEPNLVSSAVLDAINPTDFLYSQQWHLPFIDMPDAWQALRDANPPGVMPGDPGDLTFGSEEVIIAVMDTGVQSTLVAGGVTPHPDFAGNVTSGATKVHQFWDFVNMVPNNNSPAAIGPDHGTNCAGVATGRANNASVVAGENEGVAGAAPNCRLIGIINPWGGTEVNFSDAYIWVAGFNPASTTPGFPALISPGADVISNSFGVSVGAPISGLMKDCFDYLTTYGRGGKGVVLFFSSGNGNVDFRLQRPWAAYEKTIAVAASTDGDVRAGYSNFGPGIDVCAPSHGGMQAIRTTTRLGVGNLAGHTGGGLDYTSNFGGTSSATPFTAGLAASMLSINPTLTWVELRQILRDTSVKIDFANVDPIGQYTDTNADGTPDYSQWYGFGRINGAAAVTGARDYASERDIIVRENLADMGMVPAGGAFWNSPDIWVRNASPMMEGAAALPANYATPGPTLPGAGGVDNWVYVRFKNIGTVPSYDFYVRVYITHWAGPEFVYPANFTPTNRPGAVIPSPLQPGTYLIGESHYSALAAGDDDIISIRWPAALVPPEDVMVGGMSVHWHPCLLVEISPHDGPAATGTHVWDDNNLAQKNITIVYTAVTDSFAAGVVLGNAENLSEYLDIVIDRGKVPAQARLFVEFADPKVRERLREFARDGKGGQVPWPGNGGISKEAFRSITLLEEARVEVGEMVMTLPAKTRLEIAEKRSGPNREKYNFTLGEYKGREVVWLAPRGRTRLPVFAGSGQFVLMAVGGQIDIKKQAQDYDIQIIQYNPDGELSGTVGVQLRAGKRELSAPNGKKNRKTPSGPSR